MTEPGADPAAPAEPAVPAEPAEPAAPAEPKWTDGLSDETRGLAELRHWDTADKAVESYRGLEKLRGVPAERLLTLPEDMNNAEAMGEIYTRLGRPEKAEEYELPPVVIEADGDSHDLSPAFKDAAHKAGLLPQQAAALAEWYGGMLVQGRDASEKTRQENGDLDIATLRKEWGPEYDNNIAAGVRAVQWLGWTEEQRNGIERSLGTKGFLEMFARIGRGLGEHGGAPPDTMGGGGPFGMTPAAAKVKYDELMADPEFRARITHENPKVRQAAIAERTKWRDIAFGTEPIGKGP
jgi:hypothetical protein